MHYQTADVIRVDPWPSERPLLMLSLVASLLIWLLLLISLIGIVYALAIGLFLFVTHLMLIGHVRGNGVRLGADQFPELHAMVERLSHRVGLARVPEVYLLQSGGTLNAFATRFLSADILVLYSDLIDACGDNTAACEMIVGHELAHVKRGHLRWLWVLAPSYLVPFLGTALSRAREYTCDRYGHALAGNTDGALLGLTILAAGPTHGRRVNREAVVAQQATLNTGFMRLAEWLSTHPPLAARLEQLEPGLRTLQVNRARGTTRAIALVAVMFLPLPIAGIGAAILIPMWARQAGLQQQQPTAAPVEDGYEAPPPDVADAQVTEDFQRLATFLQREISAGRALPDDSRELYKRWNQVRRYEFEPIDPFDGNRYGYQVRGNVYVMWSSGPDAKPDTDDDIYFDSGAGERFVGRRPVVPTANVSQAATSRLSQQ